MQVKYYSRVLLILRILTGMSAGAGKGTLNAPFPKNPLLRLWAGKLPTNEFSDLILATGIKLDTNGYLTKESLIPQDCFSCDNSI
jgi:hypothetical protein